MIDTGALTETALILLTDAGVLVGDGLAPKNGGWASGSPNVDSFKGYSVLVFDGASPHMEGLLALPEWLCSYSIRHYGGSRQQVDWQAKVTRSAWMGLNGQRFSDPEVHKVTGIQWRQLGGVSRVDQTDPATWQAFDTVALHCVVTRG